MDQYVPPLVAVTTGAVVIFLCFTLRIPFFLVGLLSIAMAIYVFQDHITRFSSEYAHPMAPAFFKDNASILIIIVVILLSLGFLLFKFGPMAITSNAQTPYGRDPRAQQPGLLGGLFGGIGKMFGHTGQQQQQRQQQQRRSNYNYDEYARSSTYDRI